jgi:hypothetical protein
MRVAQLLIVLVLSFLIVARPILAELETTGASGLPIRQLLYWASRFLLQIQDLRALLKMMP